ncbi:hypothetical protein M153_6010003852 [Pseudoloma neurophilia]|uniref:Uncharacterized protein n=1 Tax=Pseudoloma neurophilia TaxID=146866 RepID=A0A0R0LWM4_9MICR|nr:hypothetical protein M153_6010003852 [Pseudoloma neurophilia]
MTNQTENKFLSQNSLNNGSGMSTNELNDNITHTIHETGSTATQITTAHFLELLGAFLTSDGYRYSMLVIYLLLVFLFLFEFIRLKIIRKCRKKSYDIKQIENDLL